MRFRFPKALLLILVLLVIYTLLFVSSSNFSGHVAMSSFSESTLGASLQVKIKPAAARNGGARWRVDGGAWQRSGAILQGLSAGKHFVEFKEVAGWETPRNRKPRLSAGSLSLVKGRYSRSVSNQVVFLPGDVPLELVRIPAGIFQMGAAADMYQVTPAEWPQHTVTLSHDYWIGKYEITKDQWHAVMGTEPWLGQADVSTDANTPAVYIYYNDIQDFIAQLNHYTGMTFRLPTEAEWEYACRAGTTSRYYWGDDVMNVEIGNYAWWTGNALSVSERYAHIVGRKLPNAWGLYDMSGNVHEECSDWYASYSNAASTDPSGPPSGLYHVIRGGGWGDGAGASRSTWRFYRDESFVAPSVVGFRIAR